MTHAETEAAPAPPTAAVHATARIRAAFNGHLTTLPLLRSDGPFHLRRLRPDGTHARVCVVGAMSAPLGGDRLALEATATEGAHLQVTAVAATIALRGPTAGHATYDIHLTAGEHASIQWLPQPLISTRHSNLRQTCAVDLAATARLILRDEQILGRAGEPPGRLSSHLTVRRDGRPLLDQHNVFGPDAPAWDGPAVLGHHRVTGQVLVVEPQLTTTRPAARLFGDDPTRGQGAFMPLAGPAVLITAIAPTAARLRHLLQEGTDHLVRGLSQPRHTT